MAQRAPDVVAGNYPGLPNSDENTKNGVESRVSISILALLSVMMLHLVTFDYWV